MEPGPLIVIVGETGSGKSEVALDLARRFNGEIISADAWTVRKGLDIGTAKPSAGDRVEIRHHLLDVVDPCEDFTAAVFKELGVVAIDDISSRSKVPIMVGGTGLYIDAVIYNFGFLPAGDRKAREQLDSMTTEELVHIAHYQGLSTESIDTRNKRRIIRLIESNGAQPKRQQLRHNTLIIGISMEREHLRQRIEERVDGMLAQGLEKEVSFLVKQYGWGCEALKGIGYIEWCEYFAGSATKAEVRKRIISSTLNLAKKQRTWFKRNNSIHWIDNPSKAVDLATTFLNKQGI